MEELERLPIAEARAFGEWIARYPLVFQRVMSAIQVFQRTHESMALLDLVACRDACQQLLMAAQEGGFVQVAGYFYGAYAECCRLLLFYGNEER